MEEDQPPRPREKIAQKEIANKTNETMLVKHETRTMSPENTPRMSPGLICAKKKIQNFVSSRQTMSHTHQ